MQSVPMLYLMLLPLTLIWLFPSESVPSANILAQIFSASCIGIIGLFINQKFLYKSIIAILAFLLLLLLTHPSPNFDANIFGLSALVLIAVASTIGHKSAQDSQNKTLAVVVFSLLFAAIFSALAGLLQYLGLEDALYPWVVEVLERGKSVANLRQPNLLASLLCCGIVAVVWLIRQSTLSLGMAWVLITILQLANVSTGSRIGGIESLALAGLGMLWGNRDVGLRRILVGQFLVYLVAVPLVPWVAALHGIEARTLAGRFAATSNDTRWVLWSNMIDLIRERPWFGWGWHELGYGHFLLNSTPRFSELLDNAHNLPLHLAVVFGLPAAAVICGGLLWATMQAKPWHERDHTRQFAWSILLLIVLHSMVEFPLWTVGFLTYASISIGLLTSAPVPYASSASRMNFATLASAVLLLCCALAWSQYQRVSAIYQISFKHAPQAKLQAIAIAREHWLGNWLFVGHVDYAELTTMTVTPQNAQKIRALSEKLLHFSAEPRVISAAINSAAYLQEWSVVDLYTKQYCMAFPSAYQRWISEMQKTPEHPLLQHELPKCELAEPRKNGKPK